MSEIMIAANMTLREYYASQVAVMHGRHMRAVSWILVSIAAASLASSAALTWGTPASLLAGLALVLLAVNMYWSGAVNARQRRLAYKGYTEAAPSYTFADECIVATSRYGQAFFPWATVKGVVETKAAYLLTPAIGNRYIVVPKRNIPPDKLGDFLQLLRTHQLSLAKG
jgi:hypothetical protein